MAVSAAGLDNSSGAEHTSPTVTAPAGNNTLVTYWADKSSSTSAWTAPGGQTTRNSDDPTYAGPAGWTEIGSVGGSGTAGRAYAKVASAADAATGATVRVVSSGYAKSQITVAAYEGTDATTPVAASASGQDAGGAEPHLADRDRAAGNNTLVTYWADESSATSGWTIPGTRGTAQHPVRLGVGHMSGVTVDSSNVTGSTGGLTATANSILEPGRELQRRTPLSRDDRAAAHLRLAVGGREQADTLGTQVLGPPWCPCRAPWRDDPHLVPGGAA